MTENTKVVRHYGKQMVEEDTWTLALQRTRQVFEMYDKVKVSFSGGKDSTATLHAGLTVAHELGRLPLQVSFFDEEGIPYETEQYVRRVAQRDDVDLTWYCAPFECRNACDAEHGSSWYPWAPEEQELWVRPMPPEGVTTHPTLDGVPRDHRPTFAEACLLEEPNVAWLMGIRADESANRRMAVTSRLTDNWWIAEKNGNIKAYPIYDMTTADLWTLTRDLEWDYNEAYDLFEMAGIRAHSQRIAPPFGEEPLRSLKRYRECFPEIWARLAERVPGAATAAMYVGTEIWSSGITTMECPPSMTWPQFVRHLIEKHQDPEMRNYVVKKVQGCLRSHFTKTDEPIHGTVPHPTTGWTWRLIASIASGGDTYSRRAATRTKHVKVENRPAYDAAIAALTPQELTELRWGSTR